MRDQPNLFNLFVGVVQQAAAQMPRLPIHREFILLTFRSSDSGKIGYPVSGYILAQN